MTDNAPPAGEDKGEADLGQIIHSLNQPLTAINNYAQAGSQLIDNGMTDPQRLKSLLEKIAEQSQRSIRIGEQLKDAARTRGQTG